MTTVHLDEHQSEHHHGESGRSQCSSHLRVIRLGGFLVLDGFAISVAVGAGALCEVLALSRISRCRPAIVANVVPEIALTRFVVFSVLKRIRDMENTRFSGIAA